MNETKDTKERTLHVEAWLSNWISRRLEFPPRDIDTNVPLSIFGLDSVAALELTADLEDRFEVEVPDTAAWSHPTIAHLARLVAERSQESTKDQSESLPVTSSDLNEILNALGGQGAR